jgi:hypothetical protein
MGSVTSLDGFGCAGIYCVRLELVLKCI